MKTRTAMAGWLLAAAMALPTPARPAADAAASAVRVPVEEPALDRHVRAIAETLRCLVCQGESVADSQAGLAVDMRTEIREKLEQGWSDRRIRDYFVARYGDFVLFRPPVVASTWLLWFGPLLAVVVGMAGMLVYVRNRDRQAPRALAPDEASRAHRLLRAHDQRETDP